MTGKDKDLTHVMSGVVVVVGVTSNLESVSLFFPFLLAPLSPLPPLPPRSRGKCGRVCPFSIGHLDALVGDMRR